MRWLRRKAATPSDRAGRRGPKRPRVAPWWRGPTARLGGGLVLFVALGATRLGTSGTAAIAAGESSHEAY